MKFRCDRASDLGPEPSDGDAESGPPQEAARDGVTAPPEDDEEVNLHYAVFTLRGGRLWELDGRKSFPIDHGPSSRDDLLQARCCGCRHTQRALASPSCMLCAARCLHCVARFAANVLSGGAALHMSGYHSCATGCGVCGAKVHRCDGLCPL